MPFIKTNNKKVHFLVPCLHSLNFQAYILEIKDKILVCYFSTYCMYEEIRTLLHITILSHRFLLDFWGGF